MLIRCNSGLETERDQRRIRMPLLHRPGSDKPVRPICGRTLSPFHARKSAIGGSFVWPATGLYRRVSPAGITSDERKRKELVDLSSAVSRTTKSHRYDFTRGNLLPVRDSAVSHPLCLHPGNLLLCATPRKDQDCLDHVPEKSTTLDLDRLSWFHRRSSDQRYKRAPRVTGSVVPFDNTLPSDGHYFRARRRAIKPTMKSGISWNIHTHVAWEAWNFSDGRPSMDAYKARERLHCRY